MIYCTAGKFDGELNLEVWRLGLKPSNYIILFRTHAMHNDVMHAVALLALFGTPLSDCTCSYFSATVLSFVNLRTHGFVQAPQVRDDNAL